MRLCAWNVRLQCLSSQITQNNIVHLVWPTYYTAWLPYHLLLSNFPKLNFSILGRVFWLHLRSFFTKNIPNKFSLFFFFCFLVSIFKFLPMKKSLNFSKMTILIYISTCHTRQCNCTSNMTVQNISREKEKNLGCENS